MVPSSSTPENTLDTGTGLPLGLTLRKADRERFLGLFQPPEEIQVATKVKLHLHILRVESGEFDIQALLDSMVDASISYALSRNSAQKYFSDPRASTISKVRSKFRFPELKSGEGGEVLLYSFLECHLNAPKLLSKLELKTASDDYVKAADGVHFRRGAGNDVEIIFGESKMHGDSAAQTGDSVRTAIFDAFSSMAKLRDERFNTDKWLVESNLLKESYDQGTVDLLAEILLPRPNGEQNIHNSFGVFIGYEVDTTTWSTIDLEVEEIEAKITEASRSLIHERIDYIREQVQIHGLGAHEFHFYLIPFLKSTRKSGTFGIADVRKNMARELSGKEPRENDK